MHSKILKDLTPDSLMDLKVDYAFKQLFGNENNKAITIVFLNAVLQRSEQNTIKEIVFSNIETGGNHRLDKQSRLDILVTTASGTKINVEIQFTNQYDMIKRSLYYWSDLYRSQLSTGVSYRELRPVITINILNFTMLPQFPGFHTTCSLHETKGLVKFADELEMHFIEIPKLLNEWKNGLLNPKEDILVRWLLLIGMVDKRRGKVYEDIFKELEEIAMKDPNLHQAFENWEALSATPEEREAYRVRWKYMMDEQSARREAELREMESLERGLEQGLEQGKEIGEYNAKLEFVKNLLKENFDIETVARLARLSNEDVLKIQQSTH